MTEVVVRADDTFESLKRKVEIATILGTIQSTYTDFRYVRSLWRKNAEEERLLGVSLTGIYDNKQLAASPATMLGTRLAILQATANEVNKEWAEKLGINKSAAITTIKPSGCRPADSLLTTEQGIFCLDEIEPEADGEWNDLSDLTCDAGRVTKFYRNGVDFVYRLNMNFGMSVESTGNHQWFVEDKGWVRTDEIAPGDRLEIVPGTYSGTDEVPLKSVGAGAPQAKEIFFPERMNPDLAWFMGYLWGDGCLSPVKKRIRFIDNRMDNLEKARRILLEQFGLESDIKDSSGERNAWVLEKGSSHLWDWILVNGFWKYREDGGLNRIPLCIRMSSRDSILAFFAGWFDADGHYKNGNAMFTTADDVFARHAQDVAWSVGLAIGRSHNTKGKNLQGKKSMWLMSISSNTTDDSWRVFSSFSNKADGPLKYNRVFRSGIVQSVEPLGPEETFDVETDDHWFYAGAVKSHNTVSQLVDSASGIHPRHSAYYIRSVRGDNKDPMTQFLKDSGIPNEPCVMKPDTTTVFYFPMKAPDGATTRDDIDALQHLELWKTYNEFWSEHQVSVTINVKEEEWVSVAAWVHNNFDSITGISFLPYDSGTYRQAPYQACSKEEYEEFVEKMPKTLDWSRLSEYEKEDMTTGARELACISGVCEII